MVPLTDDSALPLCCRPGACVLPGVILTGRHTSGSMQQQVVDSLLNRKLPLKKTASSNSGTVLFYSDVISHKALIGWKNKCSCNAFILNVMGKMLILTMYKKCV